MDKENVHTAMEIFMKVNGLMVNIRGRERKFILKGITTKANGETTYTMDKENTPSAMEMFMKVSG